MYTHPDNAARRAPAAPHRLRRAWRPAPRLRTHT